MNFTYLKKLICLITLSLLISQYSFANTCKRPPNKHHLDDIACSYDGLSVVDKKDKRGFVDLTGNIVVPIIYDDAYSFSNGVARVEKDNQTFFINTKGEMLFQVPNDIEVISDFKEELLIVKQNHKLGYMNKSGKMVIPFQYQNASDFREGFAVIVMNDKWGFINSQGKIVIPAQYDESTKFFDGLASVKVGDKWGVINTKGELVIPMIYDFIHLFKDSDITDAQFNGEWIKIDKQGNKVNMANKNFEKGIRHKKILEILNKAKK